jgi:CHAT domain-containing protein/predicted negative regulator of RcsB-dependent stress response
MNRMRANRFVMCFFTCLAAILSRAQSTSLKDSIAQQEQKLAQARASNDTRTVVTELNILGGLYRLSGQLQKALDDLNEALPIEQQANSLLGQGTTLMTMGRVYTDLGQEDKALALLNQALTMWRSLGSRSGEAATLSYIGKVYNNLGDHDESLKNLNASMAIWHQIDNPQNTTPAPNSTASSPSGPSQTTSASRTTAMLNGEAGTLDNLGRAYSDMGQGLEALKNYDQAVALFRQAGERNGEALVLNDMGPAYAELGQKQKSLKVYNQAIQIWRETGNRQGEALTLNDIGRLYRDLGLHQTAMDYYHQALPIWRETGNRSGEAMALSDIGRAYADLGQPQKALDYGNQALPIFRDTGNRRGVAMTLNTMGRDHSDMGEAKAAMDLDLQALVLWRDVKDERNEATALMTIAWAYSEMNEPEQSFSSAVAALGLAKSTADPEIEASIENSMMLGFRKQHHPEEAILFGLDAVNSYQQIRKNIAGLDKELQSGFVQSKSQVYRMLAELLIEAGRLGEAEQILDLLKEQELKDLVAGANANAGAGFEPIALSPAQQKAESALPDLEKKARTIEELSLTYAQIQAKPTHTPEDDAQLKSLDANIHQVSKEIHDTLYNEIFPLLDAQSAPGQAAADSTKSLLQSSLAKLGPDVMGIRLLLGDDHAYAIVVTANARKKVELPVSSADLRAKALEALRVLDSPSTDPRPQLNQLYAAIVAPLEGDLKHLASTQNNVPTLLWSLDDAIRYVPMGALYDGSHYLVERYHNVLFTPESYGHMNDSPLPNGQPPHALAMGLSKSYGGMPALPGVLPELDSVVRDPSVPDSHGPMQGKLLPDEQFTLSALKSELDSGQAFSVVHIASHFVLIAGSGDEPFLLMGGDKTGDPDGFDWNLSDMENSTVAFHGTRLLTLSACSTAKNYKSHNGLEMDGLGMVAQQKEAEAVLATLWDVNDLSTSHIMSDFYARWVQSPALGKAEALRQAQLAFLHGAAVTTRPAVAPSHAAAHGPAVAPRPAASPDAGITAEADVAPGAQTGRGFQTSEPPSATQSSLGYAHPYYWAPFVLIGNYQ